MANPTPTDDLFAFWRKQIETGTQAWADAVKGMGDRGQAPPAPPDPFTFWRQFVDPSMSAWATLQGAGPIDPGILKQWKRFLDDWLAAWTRALEQAMGTDAFAQSLGKMLDRFLTVQGAAQEAARRTNKATLDALGLPSREQIIAISRQLADVEDRLEAIEDQVEALRGGPPSASPKSRGRGRTTRSGAARKRSNRKPGAL
jgi:hypothetical protein